jgi:hypothetical protein
MALINKETGNFDYNVEGKPLKIDELNIEALAEKLFEKKIRTSQGKLIQPLHSGHLKVLQDPARFKVLACGRRWGKTLLVVLIALSVLSQTRRRVWIVAPDYSLCEKVFRELYNILVTQMKIIQPGKPGKGRARNQKGDYYLETPWGSVLEAKSLENPDSLAGEANDLVIVDEAALTENIYDVWVQMIKSTLMDKEGSAIFISTPRGRNSFYKMYLMGQKGGKQRSGDLDITFDREEGISDDMTDWSSFKQTSYDNPLLASSPEKSKEEIDKSYQEAVNTGKAVQFRQEYLADFEAVSDICFPDFKEEPSKEWPFPHVVDYNWHPNEGPIFSSSDHNYAKPASTIFAQVNKYNDVMIFDEKFTPRTTTYAQAQQILDKQTELDKHAKVIWSKDKYPMQYWKKIKFQDIVADISGDQVQLNGRSAWDDFEAVLGRRPSGLKQGREVGCNMVRQWMAFPMFDGKNAPILDENGKPKVYPKIFISRNCTNLIYALSTAKFKKTKAGALKEDYDETVEGYEGLLDALRYLMVYLFHDTGQHLTIVQGF